MRIAMVDNHTPEDLWPYAFKQAILIHNITMDDQCTSPYKRIHGVDYDYSQLHVYDCLVYWTGAGPAEYYSVQRRPGYRDYQAAVPCLFPSFVGEVFDLGQHRRRGWPGMVVAGGSVEKNGKKE